MLASADRRWRAVIDVPEQGSLPTVGFPASMNNVRMYCMMKGIQHAAQLSQKTMCIYIHCSILSALAVCVAHGINIYALVYTG